ncbi:hypothetical protein SAMN06265371_111109 [Lutibacter agarilyticus]|uniref:HU domain-containing protein n=1 Tax=Lutibacter agarilyticus TaxID=1109740 RepID=A0A238YYV4_9FLAO|nr:hypothetical protein [Lutibacter agarilyticus]SNR76162.1 hypothetical protein SAMN06265371_111109 [Lutibacter agarilyticus]
MRLKGVGNFQVGISSEGTDTPKEVMAQKITKAKVNYHPGIAFKEMLIDL